MCWLTVSHNAKGTPEKSCVGVSVARFWTEPGAGVEVEAAVVQLVDEGVLWDSVIRANRNLQGQPGWEGRRTVQEAERAHDVVEHTPADAAIAEGGWLGDWRLTSLLLVGFGVGHALTFSHLHPSFASCFELREKLSAHSLSLGSRHRRSRLICSTRPSRLENELAWAGGPESGCTDRQIADSHLMHCSCKSANRLKRREDSDSEDITSSS